MSDREPIHPLKRLKAQAEEARERREKEVVRCPECEVEVLKDTIDAAVETAETHDEKRHDGEPTAEVNGIALPQFSEEEKAELQDAVQSLRDDEGETDD